MTPEALESAQDDCLFCGIVSLDSKDQIFFSSDDVVAFLDIDPATRGHTLVVPRIHAATAFDMNEEQFSATMRGVWRVANLLRQRLNPEGLTLIQSNGAAAWQDVFPLHVHLIPRYQGGDLVRPWGNEAGTLEPVGYVDDLNALTTDLRGTSGYKARSAH
ncbi:histidine triad (HIT) family protein [Arthrobacter sp. CAN_A212]|uniref:HIT family protein n=1 Tax=Arthrobacter sp. CAN_A212 TaxID=2787719 RepID=UPI0018CA2313